MFIELSIMIMIVRVWTKDLMVKYHDNEAIVKEIIRTKALHIKLYLFVNTQSLVI